ncbi:MAG TPA: Si-specific NAD(P)(+) transhydrogenase [Gemmatimonadaceae bacterium]|nr:Si-specific NAD(P)(+) transhydrogenase [Gemmatimonadaceae bacterium]
MSSTEHFDLVVIGAGPAGEKGAAQAAYFGKKVCVIERAPKPGGAAVNTGTIPSKTLRETALYFSGLKQRGLYGVDYHVKGDITVADFMFRERLVVEAQWSLINQNLERHHVTVVQGTARFVDANTVEVTRYKEQPRCIRGDVVLVATGSRPLRPANVPFDDTIVVDSDSLLRLQSIPRRMIVIGGGVIGCEYASIFAALGVKVTIVNQRERILTQLDGEVSEVLRAELTRRLGITVVLNVEIAKIEADESVGRVTLADGTLLHGECILYCAGREGCTSELDLAMAGVKTNSRGFIAVDSTFRTAVPGVYAAGDVIGFPALASTAMEQARVAMCAAFELKYKEKVSSVLPYGVWTIPEVAMVGETEESARAKGQRYEIGKANFAANPRGLIVGDEGFVKIIFDAHSQRLLGASIVGEGACELIHTAAAVLYYEGTIDYFIQSVFNYPALSDAYKYAAYDGLQRVAKRISRQSGLKAVTPA